MQHHVRTKAEPPPITANGRFEVAGGILGRLSSKDGAGKNGGITAFSVPSCRPPVAVGTGDIPCMPWKGHIGRGMTYISISYS